MFNFEKATQPTIYFIGVTTGKSSIMKVFPEWAKAMGLNDAVIKGIDIEIHADRELSLIHIFQTVRNSRRADTKRFRRKNLSA